MGLGLFEHSNIRRACPYIHERRHTPTSYEFTKASRPLGSPVQRGVTENGGRVRGHQIGVRFTTRIGTASESRFAGQSRPTLRL
jgi:hypothetical protein